MNFVYVQRHKNKLTVLQFYSFLLMKSSLRHGGIKRDVYFNDVKEKMVPKKIGIR